MVALLAAGCGSGSPNTRIGYRVPSPAMEPSYSLGQRIVVDPRAYAAKMPSVGDVIVFHPPQGAVDPNGSRCGVTQSTGELCPLPTRQESRDSFLKRIVAGPGDRISLLDGRVARNGQPQQEPFIRPCSAGEQCTFTRTITVPAGYWFVLGDNRGQSDDSRFWGPVPTAWIVGKVVG